MLGEVMAAIAAEQALVGGVDIVRSTTDAVTRDIAVLVHDDAHGDRVRRAIAGVPGTEVEGVADRAILAHAGGTLGMRNRVPVVTRDDLSMAYTPGVARVCMDIHDDPEKAWDYTIKGNSVMVVSDGSAVVGEGDLGPLAALPAMESKCLFLRELAGLDAFPIPLTERDPERIARIVELCASPFAGVHLTDIAAPRCFDLVRTLEPRVDIPVFQDDQWGTAAALLAGLLNGLELTGKRLADARIVVAGLGPAGVATVRLLVAAGAGEVVACDSKGALHSGRTDLTEDDRWVAEHTNPGRATGAAPDLVTGADAFIGVSAPGLLNDDDVRGMARDPLVFALALPEPEVSRQVAGSLARVYATGRPDVPNQIHSALAFPGIWRGALDARASAIDEPMVLAAAGAIAETAAKRSSVRDDHVVPSVLDPDLVPNVARAVKAAAEASGVSRAS
jgi:malate dehydrogenase (oxaloacetate-decarboxylating)